MERQVRAKAVKSVDVRALQQEARVLRGLVRKLQKEVASLKAAFEKAHQAPGITPSGTNGWARPPHAKLYHLFRGGKSACGKWHFSGPPIPNQSLSKGPYSGDCKVCFQSALRLGCPRT